MSDKQNLVAAAGIGLIAANFWLGGARQTVTAGSLKPGASGAATTASHTEVKKIAGELLFVGVAVLLSGISDAAGSAMLAVIVGLAVLWSIHHYTST